MCMLLHVNVCDQCHCTASCRILIHITLDACIPFIKSSLANNVSQLFFNAEVIVVVYSRTFSLVGHMRSVLFN